MKMYPLSKTTYKRHWYPKSGYGHGPESGVRITYAQKWANENGIESAFHRFSVVPMGAPFEGAVETAKLLEKELNHLPWAVSDEVGPLIPHIPLWLIRRANI